MLLTHAPINWVVADKANVGTQLTKNIEELQSKFLKSILEESLSKMKFGFIELWVWALKTTLTHTWLKCSITRQTAYKNLISLTTIREIALT